jgi:hypothetical protein
MDTNRQHDIEAYLAHYGILGMKWGVRKDRFTKDISKSIDAVKSVRAKSKAATEKTNKKLVRSNVAKNKAYLRDADKGKSARDTATKQNVTNIGTAAGSTAGVVAGVATAPIGGYAVAPFLPIWGNSIGTIAGRHAAVFVVKRQHQVAKHYIAKHDTRYGKQFVNSLKNI